ncbi:MAG: hypothetical protein ACWGPR_11550 [Candidatus Deferrimicrobiaceae bacterium]
MPITHRHAVIQRGNRSNPTILLWCETYEQARDFPKSFHGITNDEKPKRSREVVENAQKKSKGQAQRIRENKRKRAKEEDHKNRPRISAPEAAKAHGWQPGDVLVSSKWGRPRELKIIDQTRLWLRERGSGGSQAIPMVTVPRDTRRMEQAG